MATLRQTLRGLPKADEQLVRGPGGVLQKAPTLQEATNLAGLSSGPTTPMAAQMIGASPQAAKMAGTPQQMQATLQTALRQKQYGRETTAEEKAAMIKSEDMQKLGGLGDKVTNLIQAEYNKLTPPPAPTPAAAGTQPPADTFTPVQVDAANTELAKYADKLAIIRANPSSPEAQAAMKEISTALAKDPKDIDWNKMYEDAQTAIANAAKEAIGSVEQVIKVPEIISDLGYDLPTLSTLLGVPADQLKDYTLQQLQDIVNKVASTEFTRTEQLEKQATSGAVGQAERGLARAAAREMSAIGVRASEAEMQRLNDEVSQAAMVTLFGQTKSITDWLADDEISAMIKEIVESPTDSQLRRDLKEKAPGFYSFIERNENALKDAAARIEIGGSKFKQSEEAIAEAKKATGLDEGILDAIDYKSPTETVTAPDGTQAPAVKTNMETYLDTITDPNYRAAVNAEINAAGPEVAKQLNSLTPQEMAALKIGQADGPWDRWMQLEKARQAFASAGSKDKQLSFITNSSIADINSMIAASAERKALGLPGVDISALDLNKDGVPDWDNLAEIYNTLINPKKSLKDAVSGVTMPTKRTFQLPALNATQQSLFNKFKGKPSISQADINNTDMTTAEAVELDRLRKEGSAKVDPFIGVIADYKKATPDRIQNNVLGPPPTWKGGRGVVPFDEYANRFMNLAKGQTPGGFVDWLKSGAKQDPRNDTTAVIKAASDWILSESQKNTANKHNLGRSFEMLYDAKLLTPEANAQVLAKLRGLGYTESWITDPKRRIGVY